MKIAFVVDAFPVVSETFILNQITGFIDQGHQVEIFAGKHTQVDVIHPEYEQYNLLSHTHYFNQIPKSRLYRFMQACRLLSRHGYKKPLVVLNCLNFIRYRKEALSLNLIYLAMNFISAGQFDIIYCHFGPNGLTGVLLNELGIEGSIVTSFHGYDLEKYIRRKGEKIYHLLFLKGERFLPISSFWRNRLIQLGCPEEKIIVHHMGVDIFKFKFSARRISAGEKVRIITVARLIEKKGIEYSIRAVGKIIPKFPNIEYIIIGDGRLKNELTELIVSLGLRNQVKLLGWKIGSELAQLFKNAHIFLLHSISAADGDMEGIPVSLMEAMSMGLPVVSTHHSGIPELVQDNKSGYLVKEGDIDDMSEKLGYLLDHPDLWPKMGKAGRKIIENDFNIHKQNQKLTNIFLNILS